MSEESKIALEKPLSVESEKEEKKEIESTTETVDDTKDNNIDEKSKSSDMNEDDDDDDEIDMSPAESCGFCAHFLNSPCARQFDKWRKCVEKAKENDEEDFTKTCLKFTSALAICTENNKDYFDASEDEIDESSSDDGDSSSSGGSNELENESNEEKNEEK